MISNFSPLKECIMRFIVFFWTPNSFGLFLSSFVFSSTLHRELRWLTRPFLSVRRHQSLAVSRYKPTTQPAKN